MAWAVSARPDLAVGNSSSASGGAAADTAPATVAGGRRSLRAAFSTTGGVARSSAYVWRRTLIFVRVADVRSVAMAGCWNTTMARLRYTADCRSTIVPATAAAGTANARASTTFSRDGMTTASNTVNRRNGDDTVVTPMP